MAAPSPVSAADGISFVTKGVNSGSVPRLLPPDQLAWAINVSSRGGLPHTRPVWRKVALAYPDEDTQALATEGLFQGASFHQGYGNQENVLLASIGGRLFRYQVGSSNAVTDVSIPGDFNNSIAPQAWLWQSEDFTIVQNGLANPLFFDGSGTRRSLGLAGGELPPGTVGAYVQGRNWTALSDRQSYIAGDLVYSQGFAGPYNGRDAVLKTNENTFLSGGGAFAVPIAAGPINAMTSVSIPDTSLGQGPLLVTTANSIFSIQVPLLREEWAETQYPIITIGLPSYGPLAQWSTVVINGDVWYRAQDGLRSYTIARRDFNTWVNTPLSEEVERVLLYDSPGLLGYSSGVLFDNRFLVTCSPRSNPCRGVYHQGLVALDFHNISGITQRQPPAYDGLWTGLPVLRILKGTFNGVERCFAFALDSCTRICLYELLQDGAGLFDYDGSNEIAIQSSIESRAFVGPDRGNALKRLKTADLFLDKLAGPSTGNVAVDIQYRSDQHPLWTDWHSFSLCAKISQCDFEACSTPQNLWPSYRTFVRMPEPADTCNPVTGRAMRTGYEFQVRLAWTGYAQLNRLLTWMTPGPESVSTACPTSETCRVLAGCNDSLFTYEIEPGACSSPVEDCNSGAEPPPEPPSGGWQPDPPPDPPPPPPEPPGEPPPWPDYPEEPATWPPAVPPSPPVDPDWPPEPLPTPSLTEPTLCGSALLSGWTYDGRLVRNGSSDVSGNPNEQFPAELISWWVSHVLAEFWAARQAEGVTVTEWEVFWLANTTGSSWQVQSLYDLNTRVPYSGTGWEIWVAYCIA